MTRSLRRAFSRALAPAAAALALLAAAAPASAFCGFYVAKADGELFNEASKVVMVRDGDRTVITMVNDYQGDPQEFAMVVPTPVVLKREQIHVTETALVEHLDAYTAPRLVEYHDDNPCRRMFRGDGALLGMTASAGPEPALEDSAAAHGVTIEAEYTVGEYDILILSATESGGLQAWLDQNGYRTPEQAKPVLASYIRQDMKFFVAKVNLEAQAKRGGAFLRPLQLAFESRKFMLPIRLGTVNAKGKQDLLLFTLTREGRVEAANYRTIKMPSNMDVPLFVEREFGDVYKAAFGHASEQAGGKAVITEYAWDMSWCDPCAADPLSVAQLRELGVFWLDGVDGAVDAFVTRLHVRYDAETFPEDLRLMQTSDRKNFQGRYVMRRPYLGAAECEAAEEYRASLPRRFAEEARNLSRLTGWEVSEIRAKMKQDGQAASSEPWWRSIWKD